MPSGIKPVEPKVTPLRPGSTYGPESTTFWEPQQLLFGLALATLVGLIVVKDLSIDAASW